MKRLIMGVVAVALVAVAGCSGNAAPAGPARTPAAITTYDPLDKQFAYYEAIEKLDWISPMPDRERLRVEGQAICWVIGTPGVTLETLVQRNTDDFARNGDTGYGARVARVVVDTAHSQLCPTAKYARPPWTAAATPAATPPPSAPTGPAEVITTDGSKEVGRHIKAGKWEAPGGSRCYWQRARADDPENVIANDFPALTPIVVVKPGEIFKVQNCGTWTLRK